MSLISSGKYLFKYYLCLTLSPLWDSNQIHVRSFHCIIHFSYPPFCISHTFVTWVHSGQLLLIYLPFIDSPVFCQTYSFNFFFVSIFLFFRTSICVLLPSVMLLFYCFLFSIDILNLSFIKTSLAQFNFW